MATSQDTTVLAKQPSKEQMKVDVVVEGNKSWSDNIKEWSSLKMPDLLAHATVRPVWRKMTASLVTAYDEVLING